MELKEFMEREKLSEDDIIKAASIVTKVCNNGSCKNCPLYLFENCHAKDMTGDFIPATSRRFKKLLHPNHMEKVAEMLGVKLGEPFKISHDGNNMIPGFHLEKTGLYCDESLRAPFNLTELLVGDAYIVKEVHKYE